MLFAEAFRSCGGQLIDSQVYTSNLARFGARNISRSSFLRLERDFLPQELTGNLQEEFQRLAMGVSPPKKIKFYFTLLLYNLISTNSVSYTLE